MLGDIIEAYFSPFITNILLYYAENALASWYIFVIEN